MTKQMHTHELLDRFELLYADEEPILADLRRAIIDDDLSSIFRVADEVAIQHENINDFRKAVMEKNLHSIFRVFNIFDQPVLEQDSHIEWFKFNRKMAKQLQKKIIEQYFVFLHNAALLMN